MYDDAEHAKILCRLLPVTRILAETDAPYLKPPSWNEECSSPGLIPSIIREIAKTKGMDETAVFKQIRKNCEDLYSV